MTMKKDTARLKFAELTRERLYDNDEYGKYLDDLDGEGNPAPEAQIEAAALEAYVAFTETLDTWVETLIAGRPYDTPLVEWEHRELVDIDDAKEIAANQGHRYG